MNNTIKLDEPKFIRMNDSCYYCFGNCEECNIKFMCWSGNIELDDWIQITSDLRQSGCSWDMISDEDLERKAFGNVLGRIIEYAKTHNGKFIRTRYYGNQLTKYVYINSELLYLNDKNMVCCKKKPKSVHHIKNWN